MASDVESLYLGTEAKQYAIELENDLQILAGQLCYRNPPFKPTHRQPQTSRNLGINSTKLHGLNRLSN
jgi:hypothetical protein